MRKRRLKISESFVAIAIAAVFVLGVIGAYIAVRMYEPPEPMNVFDPHHGRNDAYQALTRLIREDEASLKLMLEIASDMPVDTYLDYEKAARQYIELAGMMKARGITYIFRSPQMWKFDTEYSGGMVTSSVYYQILYTTGDPRDLVTTWNGDDAEWIQDGSCWLQQGNNIAYLEEISENFYYFYLAT